MIAIIGVLVALIMPAVQSGPRVGQPGQMPEQPQAARPGRPGVSRRVQQLPLGLVLRHRTTPQSASRPDGEPSVHVERPDLGLFLKLEQGNLYNEINFDLSRPTTPRNTTSELTAVRPDAWRRSSARRTASRDRHQRSPANEARPVQKVGPSDYRGNMAAGMIDRLHRRQLTSNCYIYDNGVTTRTRRSASADITDGTSEHHALSARRSPGPGPTRRAAASGRPSTARSTSRSCSNGQSTSPTGRASTPAWSTSPSATAA